MQNISFLDVKKKIKINIYLYILCFPPKILKNFALQQNYILR